MKKDENFCLTALHFESYTVYYHFSCLVIKHKPPTDCSLLLDVALNCCGKCSGKVCDRSRSESSWHLVLCDREMVSRNDSTNSKLGAEPIRPSTGASLAFILIILKYRYFVHESRRIHFIGVDVNSGTLEGIALFRAREKSDYIDHCAHRDSPTTVESFIVHVAMWRRWHYQS